MATISELLHKIRTAVYGREVRSAIADSIEKCYQDAQTGSVSIPDGSITADKLAFGAVTTDKIATGAVTNGKLADGSAVIEVLYDGAVVQDIQGRENFADISTVVETAINDSSTAKDKFPPTIGAVKTYMRNNQNASMSEPAYGNSRITINGVSVRVPVLDGSGASGGVIYPDRLPLVNQETAGAMTPADKQKLDAIDLEDLENLSDISIELSSYQYGYVAHLTLNGETYRIPYLNPQCKLNEKNIPTVQTVLSDNTKPVSGAAVYEYVNGSADGNPGDRKLILNINGIQYEVPMILANGKVSDSFIYTANSVTSNGTSPVNGKAVYDYIEELDIGAPTDAQVDTAVTDWMEDNIGFYLQHDIDWNGTDGYIIFHTVPDDPEMDTVLYAPLLETTNSKIASKYIAVDNTLTQAGMPADAKKTGDEITDLKSAITQNIGVPTTVKHALDTLFQNVAFKNNSIYTDEITVVHNWATAVNLISISAVYTQSGTVYDTDSLDSLKADLVVTAHYTDGTSENVLLYALTGILSVGVSTITVTYGGKTTTFNVTVTSETPTEYTWLYEYTDGLLSAQDYASIATTGTATETISDDALYLHTAKGNNNLSLNFTEETSTSAVLTAKVKLSGLGLINNSDTSGAGFRMQLSNGTAGVQAYFLDVDTAGNHKLAYYEGSTQRRIDLNNYDLNEYHIIEVRLENGAQKISIDGTELVNSNTLSTTYCTANKIMNQAGRTAGTDTDTYIKWLAFNEVS